MKYRIKLQITKKGNLIYVPQYKYFLIWKSWFYSPCIDYYTEQTFKTLEEAKEFIQKDINDIKRIEDSKVTQTIFLEII